MLFFLVARSDLLASAASIPLCVDCLQTVRSSAKVPQLSVAMSQALQSLVHGSLCLRTGRPTGRMPVASWPYMTFFGRRPSAIRRTWPSQRKRR
ncbi:hypothetical protein DPMN_193602 [Dreissena polymorpha]|uniref:Secreted protein n=1 Tax=Dreissena polymorpha TaxID=45954 RepID=A0A9D4BDG0_DREPO|nr:hypothetical protein DPMN_193602 [Dreissena polymorpha]